MRKARANSSSQTELTLVEATRRPRRGLVINSFSCAPATGVWYYRVDVSAYEEELLSTFIDEKENENDDGSSDDGRRSSHTDSRADADVEHYSILRRYNDFLQLYEQIRSVVIATEEMHVVCLRSQAKSTYHRR